MRVSRGTAPLAVPSTFGTAKIANTIAKIKPAKAIIVNQGNQVNFLVSNPESPGLFVSGCYHELFPCSDSWDCYSPMSTRAPVCFDCSLVLQLPSSVLVELLAVLIVIPSKKTVLSQKLEGVLLWCKGKSIMQNTRQRDSFVPTELELYIAARTRALRRDASCTFCSIAKWIFKIFDH